MITIIFALKVAACAFGGLIFIFTVYQWAPLDAESVSEYVGKLSVLWILIGLYGCMVKYFFFST